MIDAIVAILITNLWIDEEGIIN